MKMKKLFLYGLLTAFISLTACSNDNDPIIDELNDSGMTLNATVAENIDTKATIGGTSMPTWSFDFAVGDIIKVTNSTLNGTYYTFTKSASNFNSSDARPTATRAAWYAYFPSETIDLRNQSGSLSDVANLFALWGDTEESRTTGAGGLDIEMYASVAILEIKNLTGNTIDINVKTSATEWVTGLRAKNGEYGFDVTTSNEKVSLLTTSSTGPFYIAVPANVQISVKDGDDVVRSTGNRGLEGGKHYSLNVVNQRNNGYKFVDLGLSVKWAACNIGATNPEDFGQYFAWGETTGYTQDTSDGHMFDETGYRWCNGNFQSFTKYCNDSYYGTLDNKTVLEYADDAARQIWGGTWRMPTKAEWDELLQNCTWSYTTINGVTGCKFTSNKTGYTDKYIFLPSAGYRSGATYTSTNNWGQYWSSTLATGVTGANCCNFSPSQRTPACDGVIRTWGNSIRPVFFH